MSVVAHALGRFQAPEPASALERIHYVTTEDATSLKTADHEPKVSVLDQEDLHKQGILCSQFIPNGGDPDALGSCTANTSIEALSNVLGTSAFAAAVHALGQQAPDDVYSDTVACERAAIGFYHGCTDQTASSDQEWPPTDCGSSGPYMVQFAKAKGYIDTEAIAAHTAESIVSLLQTDGLCWGTPWFQSWFEPDASHFIDGAGTAAAMKAAIRSGVAGGHEIYISAVEKITFTKTDTVDPYNTVLRFRNHWDPSWGDQGSAYLHLSTLLLLGGQIDLRQFQVAAS